MKLINKLTGYGKSQRQIPAPTSTAAPSDARPVWEGMNLFSLFKQAVDEDKWGNVLEAEEHYQKLAGKIRHLRQTEAPLKEGFDIVSHRLLQCVIARDNVLQQDIQDHQGSISLEDMEQLVPVFADPFSGQYEAMSNFPVVHSKWGAHNPGDRRANCTYDSYGTCTNVNNQADVNNRYRAAINVRGTALSFVISKIGLKDSEVYIDPTIVVKVVDGNRDVIECKETAVAKSKGNFYVNFDQTIFLENSFEDYQRRGVTFFFEFKHYKPKKKKFSIRCWAMMDMHEIVKDTPLALEIYHKPVDFSRKNLHLHSIKKLFLHIQPKLVTA
eukprot:gene347-941_t